MRDTELADLTIRPARPGDAESLAALYRAVYVVADAENYSQRYPFPQYMDPLWFADSVVGNEYCWVVAEVLGEIIGCFGALRNTGSPHSDDRVAEQTGLVVSDKWRQRGVGLMLMAEMCRILENSSHFIIAEARTANPGGWKVARKCGFIPIGFEPFGHITHRGDEPMIMLGRISEEALRQRRTDYNISINVHELAQVTCHFFGLEIPKTTEAVPFPISFPSQKEFKEMLVPAHQVFENIHLEEEDGGFRIESSIPGSTDLFQREFNEISNHNGGIVGLKRLEGNDPEGERYMEKYFQASYGHHLLALARILWDRLDRRARILYLQTKFHGLQGILLAEMINALKRVAQAEELRTIVLDVRADFPSLHVSLGQLGFFPTVYYPSLISNGSGRIDCVQFTLVLEGDINENFKAVKPLDPEGYEVMKAVLSSQS